MLTIFVKLCLSLTFVCIALLLVVFIFCVGVESTKETPKGVVKWIYERMMEICLMLGGAAAFFLVLSLIGIIWK